MIWLLLACNPQLPPPPLEEQDTAVVEVESEITPLDAPRLLRRLSLDLLGVLPSVEALEAVEADPSQVDAYRDAWLQDERLEERLVELFAEAWLTRIDDFPLVHSDYDLDDEQEYEFERSVGEEPLRLMAHVATSDAPWDEIVTADYMLADALLAEIWPIDRASGSGWKVSRWTDDRPAVGVLASNGLWWRYPTTPFNYNRTRAAAISRLLLCEEYLERPVSFASSPSLADESGTEEAVRSDPYCLACHVSMDPIGSALFGFWWFDIYDTAELTSYHPEREPYGEVYLGIAPAWFGTPITGLNELGPAVAADGRFARCAAQTAAELLWRRPVELEDFDAVSALRQVFEDSERRYLPLLAAVTDTPDYRAGDDEGATRSTRMLSASQLASTIEALTGFRWRQDGFDQLGNDSIGFRVMAGGLDGRGVTAAQQDPNLSHALVVKRLAEGAGSTVAEAELDGGGARTLFPAGLELTDEPGDAAFDEALEGLTWRLYAERVDAAELDALAGLWSALASSHGPEAAWAGTVAALLRDPRFLSY